MSSQVAERSISVIGLVHIRQTFPFCGRGGLYKKEGVLPILANPATEGDLSAISLDKKKMACTAEKSTLSF